MKRFLTILSFLLMLAISCPMNIDAKPRKKWYQQNSRIEVVNESTVIFHNVVRIEVRACARCNDQITYVYDLKHSSLVKVARGSFAVDLPKGNYLVQSNKKITKTDYEVIIE